MADDDQAAHGDSGGVCRFDLPAYHYWLNADPAARQNDLKAWLEPFLPIHDGLAIILRLLRDNGRASPQTAYRASSS
jgi:cell division protein ZapD